MIARYVEATGLFSPAGKILLAVSGGADSVALVHIMHRLQVERILDVELSCAHVNHQLRGRDGDLDQELTVEEAQRLKLPVTIRRINVREYAAAKKMSIETAARQLRIQSLTEIARASKCSWIATGHQKNDNAETVLQRLSRGTGFRGLAGIRPMQVFQGEFRFARPLLCVTRDEIVRYLSEQNIKWREDRTNTDCSYRRNYIRHRLLPYLQRQCSGSIVEQLSELAQSAHRLQKQVQDCAEQAWIKTVRSSGDGRVAIEAEGLRSQSDLVKVELVRKALACIGCGEGGVTKKHYDKILELVGSNVGSRSLELAGGFVVRSEYGELVLCRASMNTGQSCVRGEAVTLAVPGSTRFADYRIDATIIEVAGSGTESIETAVVQGCDMAGFWKSTEQFDFDEIKLPVTVRRRAAGDRFQPLGLGAAKKVGKFLTAEKVPSTVRDKVLIISDREEILWVYPIRISEKAKVTGKTRRILRLQVSDAVNG